MARKRRKANAPGYVGWIIIALLLLAFLLSLAAAAALTAALGGAR